VDFNQLRQIGQLEIPLVGQAISPTPGFLYRIKLLSHDPQDRALVAVSIKIKIGPEVWPVIEGLYHCHLRPRRLQGGTDGDKALHRMGDAGSFVRQGTVTPGANPAMARKRGRRPLERFQSAHRHVMSIGKAEKVSEFDRAQVGDPLQQGIEIGRILRARSVVIVLPWEDQT
jgi:hypothetical protein